MCFIHWNEWNVLVNGGQHIDGTDGGDKTGHKHQNRSLIKKKKSAKTNNKNSTGNKANRKISFKQIVTVLIKLRTTRRTHIKDYGIVLCTVWAWAGATSRHRWRWNSRSQQPKLQWRRCGRARVQKFVKFAANKTRTQRTHQIKTDPAKRLAKIERNAHSFYGTHAAPLTHTRIDDAILVNDFLQLQLSVFVSLDLVWFGWWELNFCGERATRNYELVFGLCRANAVHFKSRFNGAACAVAAGRPERLLYCGSWRAPPS